MKNPHRQCKLRCGTVTRVAMLPDVKGLKVGNSVTLLDDDGPPVSRLWEIITVGSNVTEKAKLNRGWHNNI